MKVLVFLLFSIFIVGCSDETVSEQSNTAPEIDFSEVAERIASAIEIGNEEAVNTTFILNSTGLSVTNLNYSLPRNIIKQSIDVFSEVQLDPPNKVSLKDISISSGEIKNNTPYDISELVLSNGNQLVLVTFSESIPKYTKWSIAQRWVEGYEVVSSTGLSNGTIEYESDTPPDSSSRWANSDERSAMEFTHIYDHFMTNAPSTLAEITDHLKLTCSEHVGCRDYGESVENYASDTYFAKSVSGLNTRFWISDDEWGLADRGHLNLTSSEGSQTLNLWMSPILTGYVYSDVYDKQVEGWQALVHEYYHNFGFKHDTGWPSTNGVDDIFGKKVVDEYLPNLDNDLVLSDVFIKNVVKVKDVAGEYDFYLSSLDDALVSLRLLSTEALKVEIEEYNNDRVRIKFMETPETDVYVSFYTDNSQQMSSTALIFNKAVYTQEDLQSFNSEITKWLEDYDVVNVSTKNGAYAPEFILPTQGVGEGKVVVFQSQADWSSRIYYNYPEGLYDMMDNGMSFSYEFINGTWVKEN